MGGKLTLNLAGFSFVSFNDWIFSFYVIDDLLSGTYANGLARFTSLNFGGPDFGAFFYLFEKSKCMSSGRSVAPNYVVNPSAVLPEFVIDG